mmetsp:Transcript_46869/g.150586  ORF Transcript_46869/g.150586 Transcript_46869/m.150586 type:complete len:416 (-) Transcript_46869:121-1368(-)
MGHLLDALLHLRLHVGHGLVLVLSVGRRDLRDGVHGEGLIHLNGLLSHDGHRHLLHHLNRLEGDSRDLLVDILDHPLGHLNLDIDDLDHGHLNGLVALQHHRGLNHLLEVADLLSGDLLVDVLDDGLRHPANDLPDLDFGHLDDSLLVDDVGDLDDLLDVLDLDPGHLPVDVLHLDPRDLLHDLADLDLSHLDDLLLDLNEGYLLDALRDLHNLLLHLLLHLLHLRLAGDLSEDLDFLSDGHFDNLLLDRHCRHLDEFIADLVDRLLNVHDLSLALLARDLLDDVDDLDLGHLDHDLLVQHLRHLDDELAGLVDVPCDLLHHLLVLHDGVLLHQLVLLLLLDLDDPLAPHPLWHFLLNVLEVDLRNLNHLLPLHDLMNVLEDSVHLFHLPARHLPHDLLILLPSAAHDGARVHGA